MKNEKINSDCELFRQINVSDFPFLPQAVVVGNGDFPKHSIPLQILDEASYVICCDGAVEGLVHSGRLPDLIVGDGDSLPEEFRMRFHNQIHYISEQETNDQTKAVRFLAEKGLRRIAILGATGKREDHMLGNVSLLIEYHKLGVEVMMLTDFGYFIPATGTSLFSGFPKQQVSIFNFGSSSLESEGLRYPIYSFTNWWQGTLNEVLGHSFVIHASGDYLVYCTYAPKF